MGESPRQRLERAVLASMVGEVDALKPGNVNRFAGGHGMRYQDFVRSAELSAPLLCDPALSLGRKVLESVRATRAGVGVNTNLGILLLFAPVVCACERHGARRPARETLRLTLDAVQKNEADYVFTAIVEAAPGGLGHVPEYDVHSRPDCGLIEAMTAAADRDLIARQYANGFEQVYTVGLAALQEFTQQAQTVEWAVVGCYLRFLAAFPDSHVARKFGPDTAERIRTRSRSVLEQYQKNKDPGTCVEQLLAYDKELKDAQINPGTSADLTAASLLLYYLGGD